MLFPAVSQRWLALEPQINIFVQTVYQQRSKLAIISSEEALCLYQEFLNDFAKILRPDVCIKVFFSEDASHARADAPVLVNITSNVIALGVGTTFFEDTIPGSARAARLLAALIILVEASARLSSELLAFTIGLMDEAYQCDVGFCSRDEQILLIPDADYLLSGGHVVFREVIARSWMNWDDRMSIVMWRGSTTGIPRSRESLPRMEWYKLLPRLELCARLKRDRYRGLCNVGISSIVQIDDLSLTDHINRFLKREFIKREEQMKYKYLIDIDGNTNAWSGLMQSLVMGGCVIKIKSEKNFRQWYYNQLEPGYNFVPVCADMSDLEEKIDWCMANDSRCRTIAAEARRLAERLQFDTEVDAAVLALIDRFTIPSPGASLPQRQA